jgi:hypothetical protein
MTNNMGPFLVVAIVCMLTGCIYSDTLEVRPGVYAAQYVDVLPLPTSGYDIYLIGEYHNQLEIHLFFLHYLEVLNKTTGLRDVVLEAEQYREKEFNDYILGIKDTIPPSYFSTILDGIKTLNESLLNDQKIRVHPVDVDFSLKSIQIHVGCIKEQVGPPAEHIEIPSVEDEQLGEKAISEILDRLMSVVQNNTAIFHEIETVQSSLEWYRADKVGASIREKRIAANIQHVIDQQKPVLALYGGFHTRKTTRMAPESQPWAQRLTTKGVNIYLVMVTSLSGTLATMDPESIYFNDGTTVKDVFEAEPECSIVYIDLRAKANESVRCSRVDLGSLGAFDSLVPLPEMFDGIILFRETTLLREIRIENKGIRE